MISAALAILETEEERSELSQIYEHNIKRFYSIAFSKLQQSAGYRGCYTGRLFSNSQKPQAVF